MNRSIASVNSVSNAMPNPIYRKVAAALTSLWLIVPVALALRLNYAWDHERRTPHTMLSSVPFLYEPGAVAYSLAVGKGFANPFRVETGPTAWETPVYPLILSGVFRVFGTYTFSAFAGAVLLNIVFSSFACVPIFSAGKHIAGGGVAAGAAWLWAIFPGAVIVPYQWIWDTCLSALLAATILWATLALAESSRTRDWVMYGALWGLALMTNATLAALLPFLLGWVIYRAWRRGQFRIARPALAAGVIVLCCVPWTVRNYATFHSFVPLRSVLGLQLWMGNNDAYREQFPGWLHPINNPVERAKYARMGEILYMHEKKEQALTWMISHPAREAHLFEQRFVATWLGTPHPVKDFLSTHDFLIRTIFVCNFIAAIGALSGIIVLFLDSRTRAYAFPVAVYPLFYPIVFYLSQALLRYRYPIDPIVLLLTAVAFGKLLRTATPFNQANKRVYHQTA